MAWLILLAIAAWFAGAILSVYGGLLMAEWACKSPKKRSREPKKRNRALKASWVMGP